MAASPIRFVTIIAACGLVAAGIAAIFAFTPDPSGTGTSTAEKFETAAGRPGNGVEDEGPSFPACRHPMHGVESWREQEAFHVDSGWKLNALKPPEYCGREQMKLQTEFPNRTFELLGLEHTQRRETNYDVVEDRTVCHFRSSWHPVYKLDRSKYCRT